MTFWKMTGPAGFHLSDFWLPLPRTCLSIIRMRKRAFLFFQHPMLAVFLFPGQIFSLKFSAFRRKTNFLSGQKHDLPNYQTGKYIVTKDIHVPIFFNTAALAEETVDFRGFTVDTAFQIVASNSERCSGTRRNSVPAYKKGQSEMRPVDRKWKDEWWKWREQAGGVRS